MTERDIFLAAIEITDPDQQAAYVAQACGSDAALRAQVEKLLSTHEQTSRFLETPAVAEDSDIARTVVSDSTDSDDDASRPKSQGEAELRPYMEPATRPGCLGRLGHYEIESILGRGAFGIVAKAFDDKLHRVVAIKMLSPELAATSPPRKRFLREARSAAAVQHENIAGIHAVEEEPIPYLVMEYVPGLTLQQRMEERGPLEVPEVVEIGRQIAAGLAAAHAVKLIHRDIKPSNILLTGGPHEKAKISDFGLARAADDASLTASGVIAGTPMYMAPEQARGEALDPRADLFSLGCVLYQMISGRPPFRAANTVAVLKRVCEDTPRPLEDVIPETPGWLADIVFHLLEKKRDERFQSAAEVADLLERCGSELRHGVPVTGMEERPPATVRMELPADARPAGGEAASHRSRNVGIAIGIVLAMVVFLMVFVISPQLARRLDTPIPSLPNEGVVGGLRFDGRDDWVAIDNLDWNYPQFTIEAFVTSAPAGSKGTIAFLGNESRFGKEWMSLFDGPPTEPGKRISGANVIGKTEYVNAYGPYKAGERQHRALVFDGRYLHYYINGVWQGERYAEPHEGMQWNMTKLRIGCDGGRRQFFQGVIDQIRVSRVARYNETFQPILSLKSDDATLALYDFQEGNGQTLIDRSGNGHDGVIHGGVWVTKAQDATPVAASGSTNFGLKFDGKSSHVALPFTYDGSHPLTIEMRVSFDANAFLADPPNNDSQYRFQAMISNRTGGAEYRGVDLLLRSSASKTAFQADVNGQPVLTLPQQPRQFVDLAAVFGPKEIRLYVDGKRQPITKPIPEESCGTDIPFLVGMHRAPNGLLDQGEAFAGVIDEIRISDVARYSEAEVPVQRLDADEHTLALYRFDDGHGDELRDSSGHKRHGKIIDAEWVAVEDE